ncbi:phage head morphogenesis protein [Metabacillus idriensis]|uniref:phage minor head protein n=1 Tax=Metabacillus idriensis TaxID=324768 RepID=UPI00203A98D0|nr:phage minor head protein [Metabacillus idriensis]MCM3598700.1 phage head morphogenesis protein [Metabacillus idriensis]
MNWEDHDQEKQELTEELLLLSLIDIRKLFESILKEIMFELSNMYIRLERHGELTYHDVKRHRDLDRFQRRVVTQTRQLGKKNREIIERLLEDTYDLSYSYMSYSIETQSDVVLKNATPHLPEILAKVKDNPIKGLKLEPAMERDRAIITSNINKGIERGFKAGETYAGIAKEIQKEFDSSYGRAVKISRTEAHRVREQASHESAMNSHRQGVLMNKTWKNMKDQRVRPGRGIGKKAAKGGADHVNMEGQKRMVDKVFNLKPNGTAQTPGTSGIAGQDINCRCYASYRVERIEKQDKKKAAEKTYKDWKALKDKGSS